jgi:ferric enterobactin receptor
MNKQNILVGLFMLLTMNVALAQFPGGGRPSGDGNGRAPRAETPTTFDMDANTPKGNSKITGFVIDSAVTVAVEYANVALINKATNKVVDGGMADGNGKFDLTKVAVGTYNLKVSFIGYNDAIIENIKIKKGEDIDLGIIKLAISSKFLDDVTLNALKNIIE